MRNDTKKRHRGLKPSHKLDPTKFYARRAGKSIENTVEETKDEYGTSDGGASSKEQSPDILSQETDAESLSD